MEEEILRGMFLHNDGIVREIEVFCQRQPGVREARESYSQLARELEEELGSPWYLEFEARLNHLRAMECRAWYLFGLGLRKDLLDSLMG